MYYKQEFAKDKIEKLHSKLTIKQEELNSAREEIRSLQMEIMNWEAKYTKLFEQKINLLNQK